MVVTFLSMLGQEAEQGGVHRMLGICAEFERIAKAVIEKAEKEQSSRRKRKNQETPLTELVAGSSKSSTTTPGTATTQTPRRTSVARPTTTHTHTHTHTPPSQSNYATSSPLNDPGSNFSVPTPMNTNTPPLPVGGWSDEFAVGPLPQNGDYESFDFGGQGNMNSSPASQGSMFQQPLLPADLFSLPMTLDWNWAEMSGGAYPTVENGNFGHELQDQHQHISS